MTERKAEAGSLLKSRTKSAIIAAILDGDTLDVLLAADAAFAGAAKPVGASFIAAPAAALGIVGAWVSNLTTGVITIRFCAVGAGFAGGTIDVFVQQLN